MFIRFTANAFRKLLSVYVLSYFPFGFEGRMWDLIVSVLDHCLSFYFSCSLSSCLRFRKRELVFVLLVHLFVCFAACMFLSLFSSSWCRGLAVVCDCGIPWTFLLLFNEKNEHENG